MTRQLFTDAGLPSELRSELRPSDATPGNLAAMAWSAGALLAELECSLEAGQRALLSRDLAGLERATSEQIGLHRSLQALGSQNGAPKNDATPLDPALAAGLRAAQWRVLYLGRVQAALLTRAQRSLRMLSNLLAGPGASYAAPNYSAPGYAASGYAGPSYARPVSTRPQPWPGWMPARAASARLDNAAGNQVEPLEARNQNRDEEEADPCRV